MQGLTAVSLPYLQTIPDVAAVLPADFDEDQAAADHYQLFGFNVFPYQSIFLDPAGLLGGSITDEVVRSYSQAGLSVGPAGNQATDESPDHLGYELRLMAFLCAAEADAWRDGLPAEAGRMAGGSGLFWTSTCCSGYRLCAGRGAAGTNLYTAGWPG